MGMVVDIGAVKRHVKPKADSTLLNMRKAELIQYIRTLEHNYNVAVSFNENQARYIESLDAVPVVRCEQCRFGIPEEDTIIPNCHKCVEGADLDEETGVYYGFTSYHSGDFYCAFGERRTDALPVSL